MNAGPPQERNAGGHVPDKPTRTGPLAWMARNIVAANLMMAMFIFGGLIFSSTVKQEVFPEVDLDVITVAVAYPGASPAEVEEGVVLAVEEEVRGVDGIKRVSSVASEGLGTVAVELLLGADADRALNDIKSAVDRITSFPLDAERPVISLATSRRQVLSVLLHGDVDIHSLDRLAERVRRELLADERITLVEKRGLPPPEISIEVPQEALRRHGLTLNAIAQTVAESSIDLPGGSVKTSGGEVLVRTTERRDWADEFAQIAVISRPDGSTVRLGEIADVLDGYRDTDQESYYEGERAVELAVFRVGDEGPLDVAAAVHEFRSSAQLPSGIGLEIVSDESEIYEERISMLVKNGRLGALLVVLVLGLFLHPRVAFWVSLGIPISFLGAFFVIPALGVSINMISLFAFVLVLGIVVDDAVVVGESIFHQRSKNLTRFEAAVDGTREVLMPVVFAVLTTIIAFAPLLFVPGVMGKFFRNVPLIVIPILVISLVESLLILPAHLAHVRREREHSEERSRWPWLTRIMNWQVRFSDRFEQLVERRMPRILWRFCRDRYLTLAVATAILILSLSLVAGGRLKFDFFPRIEGDQVSAVVELPYGAPVEETRGIALRLADDVRRLGEELRERAAEDDSDDAPPSIVEGVYTRIGTTDTGDFNPMSAGTSQGGHVAVVTAFLLSSDEREMGAEEFSQLWRERTGELPGVERLAFNFAEGGPSAGAKVSVQLAHDDTEVLERAAEEVAAELAQYGGVFDVDDGFTPGKPQLDLELKPGAKALGVDERDLAAQVRAAFFGAEAIRQQRGRDELRVYVRRPEAERDSVHFIENLVVQTPGGGELPLRQAATVAQGHSFTEIIRVDGRRTVTVTSDVDPTLTTGNDVRAALVREVLPPIVESTPGLTFSFSGEQEAQAESIASMGRGLAVALLAMYGLMAIAFGSYGQPLVVLVVIPFGLIGAIFGHVIMGYSLSFLSVFGFVALAGVVVNDSLVLISAINDLRRQDVPLLDAVIQGTTRRVRPVLLTSLTTFFGLAPIIMERSLQARFLVPMALSLGFGVLFVTGIALVLVPCSYLVLHDVKRGVKRLFGGDPQPVDEDTELTEQDLIEAEAESA